MTPGRQSPTPGDNVGQRPICAKDGSEMWERETFPGFSIWSCFAAAHHIRLGAPPPPLKKYEEPLTTSMKARRGRPPKTDRIKPEGECGKPTCRRPAAPGFKQCAICQSTTRARLARIRERDRASVHEIA